ncbi:MAG: PAS domain S-box protein [Sulfurimonas sp.]
MRGVFKNFNSMNGLVILFVIFTVILSGLLAYLQKIDEKFEEHTVYGDNIKEVILLDQKLDNFFLQKYQYLDFDTIKNTIDRLDTLFDTCLMQEDYRSYHQGLNSLYAQKKRLVENFKSLNSRMTNAVHYIYDLRRSIKNTDIKGEKREAADEIFFQITQLIMDIPINREVLQENIDMLRPLVAERSKCDYFLRQVKVFLKDFDTMKGYLDENRQIGFHEALQRIETRLEKEHHADIYKQKMVALIFFGLAFFVLVLLILNYRKVIKATRELLAFRYAIENSDNTVLITDKDRNIIYVNDAFEQHTGYKKSEVIGAQPSILKSGLMSEGFYEEMNSTLEKGEKWQGELINKKKDGSLFYEKASISPIIINGKVVQYLAIKLDITDYIEYQNKLKQSSTVFENTQEGILILDENKKIKTANRAFKTMTGFQKEKLKNSSLDMFVTEENDTGFYQRVWSIIDKKDVWTGKISISKHNGEKLPIWLSLSTVRDKDGSVINY